MAATHYQIFCRYYHSAVNRAVINDIHVAKPTGWRSKSELVEEKYSNREQQIFKQNDDTPDNPKAGRLVDNETYRYYTRIIDAYGGDTKASDNPYKDEPDYELYEAYYKDLIKKERKTGRELFSSEAMTNNSGFNNKDGKTKLFFDVKEDYLSTTLNDIKYNSGTGADGNFRYTYMALENVWVRFEDYLLATTDKQQAANLSSARLLDATLNEIITNEADSENPKYDMVFIYDGIAQENAAKCINYTGNKITNSVRKWTYYGNKLWKIPKKYRANNEALMTYFNPDSPTDIAIDISTERYSKDPAYYNDSEHLYPDGTRKPIGLVSEEGVVSNIDFSEGIRVIVDPADFQDTYAVRDNTSGDYNQIENVRLFTMYAYKKSINEKTYTYVYTREEVPVITDGVDRPLAFFLTKQDAEDLLLGIKSTLTVKLYSEVDNTGNYEIWSPKKTDKLAPENFVKVNSAIGDLEIYTYKTESSDTSKEFELEEKDGLAPKVYYEKFKRFEFSPWFVYANCGSLKQAMTKAEELVNIVGIENLIIGKVVDLTQYIEIA